MLLNWLQRSSLSSVASSCLRSGQLSSSSRCSLSSVATLRLLTNHNPSSSSHRRFKPQHDGIRQRKQQSLSFYERLFASASTNSDGGGSPLRRRRKPSRSSPNNSDDNSNTPTTSTSSNAAPTVTTGAGAGEAFFSPINTTTGQLLTSDEYLAMVQLSPWVPCPDIVSKRVFEIANATSQDIHVDLGCGDGRLNFMAVDNPSFNVVKSWGVDVDENILKKCYERLGRRFVPSTATNSTMAQDSMKGGEEEIEEEENRLEFIQADLIKVIEQQKTLYQQQQQQQNQPSQSTTTNDDNNTVSIQQDETSESTLHRITNKVSNSTIITMYFVDKALHQIQPYLSSILGGKQNVRVITIGYEMPNKDGWEPSWVERVLGLTIFRYDMENVTRFPSDWKMSSSVDYDDENDGGKEDGRGTMDKMDNHISNSSNNESDVEEFLRRKRQEDMEELNRGLRIHHDEELDEFAHARTKKLLGDHSNINA
ncbi:hypothetical protein ACHAWC_000877, partial [Mediolabrus comicus]